MALSTKLTLNLAATLSNALDLSGPSDPLTVAKTIRLATGVGSGQADKIFHDRRTLGASATEDLDLAGVLVDPLGQTMTLARLKGLIVIAASTNANDVNVSRPAANGVPLFLAASDAMPVKPDGMLVWCAPGATGVIVTPGTADLLTFTNSAGGTSVTYDVVIIGASA